MTTRDAAQMYVEAHIAEGPERLNKEFVFVTTPHLHTFTRDWVVKMLIETYIDRVSNLDRLNAALNDIIS